MATVNFLYRSTKERANLHLRLLYRFKETDFVFGVNTKCEVFKNYWESNHVIDKKTKKIKGTKDPEILNKRLELTNELSKIENYILTAFNSADPLEIDKVWLQNQMELYYNPIKENESLPTELLKYFNYFIECKKNEVANSTLKKYNVIKHLLERYITETRKKIQISDVNDNFKINFENYCLIHKYAPSSISKYIKTIKTVCYHAKHNGIETSHQLDKIKTPQYETEKIYLTFEELEKIEQIDKRKLNYNYENAKDWLIISCFTGQRISDFMRFKKEMIRYERNKLGVSKPFIEFTQVKTEKIMTVALHPKVIEILEKRKGNFPNTISDQKYNLYIKQVCRIAKIEQITIGSKLKDINEEDKTEKKDSNKLFRKEKGAFPKWELVTSHIGRRSFATNFYGLIPTTYLINVTGHSSESMFLNYIGKSNKDLAMEITNYF